MAAQASLARRAMMVRQYLGCLKGLTQHSAQHAVEAYNKMACTLEAARLKCCFRMLTEHSTGCMELRKHLSLAVASPAAIFSVAGLCASPDRVTGSFCFRTCYHGFRT